MDLQGLWYVDPERRVSGTLRIEQGGKLRLELSGPLLQGDDEHGERILESIYGVAYESKNGNAVTLKRAFAVRRTFGTGGVVSEEYVANYAYFGSRVVETEETFDRLAIQSDAVLLWLGGTGLSLEAGTIGATYRSPDPIQFEVRHGRGRVGLGASQVQERHRLEITEHATLALELAANLSHDQIQRELTGPLHHLLTIVVGEALPIDHLRYRANGDWFEVHHAHVLLDRDVEARRILPPLLPLRDIGERLGEFIQSWLDLHENLRGFMQLFFALWFAPPPFVDEQLDMAVNAVLRLASRGDPDPAVSTAQKSLVDSLQEALAHPELLDSIVPTAVDLEAGERLVELLDRHRDFLASSGSAVEVAAEVLQMAARVHRRNLTGDGAAPSGKEMFDAAVLMRRVAVAELLAMLPLPEIAQRKVRDALTTTYYLR